MSRYFRRCRWLLWHLLVFSCNSFIGITIK